MNHKIIIPAFFLMVLVQLYVPASLIFRNERVILSGTEYKFKTAPIDPNDPFRGKYIILNFEERSTTLTDSVTWQSGTPIYVSLTTDDNGYAKIMSLSAEEPLNGSDYITASVDYVIWDTLSTVYVQYPFDRFYMEEKKAPMAEDIYNAAAIDSNQVAYAVVMVNNGNAVVRDVMIDDVSVLELIEQQ